MLRAAVRSLRGSSAIQRARTQAHRSGSSLCARALSTETELPSDAAVVVIGGGVIGTSVAYHLAKMGVKDVVLLEQSKLTSGTTWHAAGLMVTYGSLSETSTEIRKYSKNLYANVLEQETGQSTGFKPVGFIELATERDRLEEYRRIAAFNRKCGVDVQEISAEEVKRLFPLCDVRDVMAGFYVADDGRVNPVDLTMSLAKGAKLHGAKVFEDVSVAGVTSSLCADPTQRRVTGVTLTDGRVIRTDKVVNCAGMWARELGARCGVCVPNSAAEHYYLLTEPIEGVQPDWPVIEDPNRATYIRPEAGGLLVGLFERDAQAWAAAVHGVPRGFSFGEISPDWDRVAPALSLATQRVPLSQHAGVKTLFCGPESFTADGAPLLGESPELNGFFVAAGLNSVGVLSGGGVGRTMAHLIVHGKADVDITGMHINRVQRFQNTPRFRAERVGETLSGVYETHFPYKTKRTARGAKRSPFYDRFAAKHAYFKDVSGWEGADWFVPAELAAQGVRPAVEEHSWQRESWFPFWEREHAACRESAALFDMSFMSKFVVQGKDAGECVNRLCTADVDGERERITYTQWLNDEGKMEADLTVSKLADDKFLIVATDTMHRHVESWARRHLNPLGDKHVFFSDVTGAYAQLNIQGPRARELLQRLTDTDMTDSAFPFRCMKEIDIGFANLLCARITYVGELGYELFIPTEHALHVYEEIEREGASVGLTHCGLKALASLRMEKAYRDYGHDMDNTDTLLEVGLGFTADYKKPGGFIGKEATLLQRAALQRDGGLPQRLVQLLVTDPQPLLYHGEVVYRDGVCVGDVRAASYGHSLGGAVGLAHVTAPAGRVVNKEFLATGEWTVDVAGTRFPCRLSLAPMYDPQNLRIKA